MVELSPTAAQVWSFNQDLWEGKNKIIGRENELPGDVTVATALCDATAAVSSAVLRVFATKASSQAILAIRFPCKKEDVFAH